MHNQLHILIGVLYNRNGIAAWCIEAARALQQAGCRVTLVANSMDWLPEDLKAVAWIVPLPQRRTLIRKIKDKIIWWGQFFLPVRGNPLPMREAYYASQKSDSPVDVLLVAQTDFIWPDAPVPQWVVARAWPVHRTGYLSKMRLLKSQPFVNRLHDLLYWYKMDLQAYRQATGVLAITHRLAEDLQQAGYRAFPLYPCIRLNPASAAIHANEVPRLLMVALDLADPRKNIPWMLEALTVLVKQGMHFQLTLAGGCDATTQARFSQWVPQVQFTGPVSRQQVQKLMRQHDLLLFASLQENWGYVLIEAMAQGMGICTPRMYPFDEINPEQALMYEPNNRADFVATLKHCLNKPGEIIGNRQAWQDHCRQFGPENFSKRLLSYVNNLSATRITGNEQPLC